MGPATNVTTLVVEQNTLLVEFTVKPAKAAGNVAENATVAASPYPHFDIENLQAKSNFLLITPEGWKVDSQNKDTKQSSSKDTEEALRILTKYSGHKIAETNYANKPYNLYEFTQDSEFTYTR